MTLPVSWSARAFNPVPESENEIHGDAVARAYGFRGGLVPGVTVSAYLLHPAAVAWGRDWAERGRARAVVHSPVYDGETFRVDVKGATPVGFDAELADPGGTRCASAEVSLPDTVPTPPARRGDPLRTRGADRPVASREVMERLRDAGLQALPARWNAAAEITTYLRDAGGMAPVYRDEGLANPAFVLGTSNWVLGQNLRMRAWLHLETTAQHHAAIEPDTELVVEAAIVGLFEKKGHEFADVDVGVFGRADDRPYATIRLRAIYKLRDPSA